MTAKKSEQTEGTLKVPRPFYRRVIHSTNGRLLNLTPIIPEGWEIVKVIPERWTENRFFFTVINKTGEGNHAQVTAVDKPDKQVATASR